MHHATIKNDLEFLVSRGTYQDFERFVTLHNLPSGEDLFIMASVLLELAIKIDLPQNTIDICGTGGDVQIKTTNISTICALVLARSGVSVVKHCGGAVSSASGSADFISFLKTNTLTHSDCLRQNNYCFLKAGNFHPAYKYIAPFRKIYGKPTVFNMLGPMINPAKPLYRMVGTSFPNIIEYAKAFDKMGCIGCVVQSQSGCDELLSFEDNTVVEFGNGNICQYTIAPSQYGIPMELDNTIDGKTPQENFANAMYFLENPKQNTLFYTVALNCGLASKIYGKAANLQDGIMNFL